MAQDIKTPTEPVVGQGATLSIGSDCYPYTVIAIKGTTIAFMQADKSTRTDRNGQSEDQSYEYTPNPKGEVVECRKGKYGWKRKGSSSYSITFGKRTMYQDPSF